MARHSIRSKAALGISCAMALVQGAPALAQDATDIVVTARRVEERLQDVPISITVFSQEQITQKNIVNANDLALYTPSLGASNPLGSSSSVFSLRGFNTDQGTAPTVGVFFNDVVAPRGAQAQSSLGDGAGVGSFFDLQNLQVLKGPQGTLFGRNTTGGAILLVPQKPTGNFEGYIEGSIGNYDLRRVQAVLNLPASDTVRLRLGIDRQKRDGYVKNNLDIGPRDFNDVNYVAARASLVLDVTPDLENYTVFTYSKDDTDGEFNTMFKSRPSSSFNLAGNATDPVGDIRRSNTTAIFGFLGAKQFERFSPGGVRDFYSTENVLPDTFTTQEVWQAINTTTWRASDNLTIKNIFSYGELKYNSRTAVFGTAFDAADINPYGQLILDTFITPRLPAGAPAPVFRPFAPGTYFALSGISPGLNTDFSHQSTLTEELQFQGGGLDGKLDWQGGFYYEISKPIGDKLYGALSPALAICPETRSLECANPFFGFGAVGNPLNTKETRSMGIYAQASYDLTDQLKLTGGIRYTWDRTRAYGEGKTYAIAYSPYATNPLALVTAGPARCTNPNDNIALDCGVSVEQKSKAPTWLIDLDYKPNPDLLLYIKWARGYRAGGTALQMPSEYRTYDPEKVDTYEVGSKLSLSGAVRGTINFAAFYNDFSNQQVSLSIVPRIPGTVPNAVGVRNAGKSRIWGIELESNLELFDGFMLSGGYSYLNAKIKRITPTVLSPTSPYVVQNGVGYEPGDPLNYTPEHKLSVTAAYTLPLDESIGSITLSGSYTYIAKQVTTFVERDADGDLTGDSFLTPRNLVDASITWKDVGGMPIDLQAFGNNIFQEKYHNYYLDARMGFLTGQVGTPRMYGLRLKYRWGS